MPRDFLDAIGHADFAAIGNRDDTGLTTHQVIGITVVLDGLRYREETCGFHFVPLIKKACYDWLKYKKFVCIFGFHQEIIGTANHARINIGMA